MKKKKVIFISILTVLLLIFSTTAASAKVMWGKTELKQGQIGKVTILSDVHAVKINGSKIKQDKKLKKGEEYRVYRYQVVGKNGYYGLGGGLFVQKSSKVKYETPSKAKLALLEKPSFLMDKKKVYTYKFTGETVKYTYQGKYDNWDKWGTNDGNVFLQYEDANGLYTGWIESEYYVDIQYPIKVGKSWEIGYEGEGTAKITSLSKTVKTPAGTFYNCIEINENGFIVYYAKNIGVVKSLYNGKVVSELIKLK